MDDVILREVWKYCTMPQIYNWSLVCRQFRKCYRETPLLDFVNKATSAKEKLQIMLSYFAYLPPQGSPQWLAAKRGDDSDEVEISTIGGSEISTVLGFNDYDKTGKMLVASKLGLSKFEGNAATRWGNLFEEVAAQLMEVWFRTDTYETGSIPGMRNSRGQVMQKYSPDRIGVISTSRLLDVLAEQKMTKENREKLKQIPTNGDTTVLFEFKCPTSRIPNLLVPDNYRAQPQLGMHTIPIIDMSLFVDSVIRKCSIEDFGWNTEYDTLYHSKDTEKGLELPAHPLVCGFVGIYDTEGAKVLTHVPRVETALTPEQIDCLAGDLQILMVDEMETPGSDYHDTPRNLSGVVPLISLADKLMASLYGIHEELHNARREDEYAIIHGALCEIMPDLDAATKAFMQKIIPEAAKMCYRIRAEKASLDDVDYGMDFGAASAGNFDIMLKKVVDERFKDPGFRAYYPEGFYVAHPAQRQSEEDREWQREGDYVDLTLDEPERAQQWLCRAVKRFTDFCAEQNFRVIGIIPWKLFQVSIIPVFRDAEFLDKIRQPVEQFTDTIQNIKQKARGLSGEERKRVLQEEYDKIYPPSTRTMKNRERRAANIKTVVVEESRPRGGVSTAWDDVET
jgi:hypothetical protein